MNALSFHFIMLIPHLKIVDWWPDYRFGEAPVDDAPLVRGFKGFGDLLRDWDCFVDRHRSLGDGGRQCHGR